MVLSEIQIFQIFWRVMTRCRTWILERLIVARPQSDQIQQAYPTWAEETNSEERSNSDSLMKNPGLKLFWTLLSMTVWIKLSRFRHRRHTRKRESIPPCFSRQNKVGCPPVREIWQKFALRWWLVSRLKVNLQ